METVTTTVTLRELTSDEIEAYVATDVGLDKAGGLALQSEAMSFIDAVDGCWANVLGLPLCAVARLLGLSASGPTSSGRCTPRLCGSYRG